MAETGKPEPGQRSDEETLEILRKQSVKKVPAGDRTPALTGEAANAIQENIKKKGEVWKKKPKKIKPE